MLSEVEIKWVPVRTASKLLGVSMKRVYQLIEEGSVTSRKVDCTVLVSVRSLVRRQLELPGVRDVAG